MLLLARSAAITKKPYRSTCNKNNVSLQLKARVNANTRLVAFQFEPAYGIRHIVYTIRFNKANLTARGLILSSSWHVNYLWNFDLYINSVVNRSREFLLSSFNDVRTIQPMLFIWIFGLRPSVLANDIRNPIYDLNPSKSCFRPAL